MRMMNGNLSRHRYSAFHDRPGPSKASFQVLAGTRGKYGTLPSLVGEDKENYDPLSGLRAALPGSSAKKKHDRRKPLRDVGFYPLEDPPSAASAMSSSASSSSSSDSACGGGGGKLAPRQWRMRSCFDDKENQASAHANAMNKQQQRPKKRFGAKKQSSLSLKPLNHSPAASELSCEKAAAAGFASPVCQSIFGAAHIPSPHPMSGDKCGRKIKRTVRSLRPQRHNVCAIR